MTPTPIELFGTDEPPPTRRMVTAGPLSAVLEGGGLRDIRFHGIEVLRSIAYLARDAAWGTYPAEIQDLSIDENKDGFFISYNATCGSGAPGFAYRMRIAGDGEGNLMFDAAGRAIGDFTTNRTGFVILHPAEAAGGTLTITHSDGQIEEMRFPGLISPDQPAFDMAAMSHHPAPGLRCDVKMSGDAFEMEDQRNWADASFKTYVRPLAKPRPYVISSGETDIQQIAVKMTGKPLSLAGRTQSNGRFEVGNEHGTMPGMALFLDPGHLPDERGITALPKPVCSELIVRLDLASDSGAAGLDQAVVVARRLGAGMAVELIFDARDPDREAAFFLSVIAEAGIEPSALLVSPRREFKTRPSNILPPGEQDTDALVSALRRSGARCPIGAGTVSNFTEFNRNPPGPGADFIYFGVAAIIHAADDISVMETAGVYPALIDTARARAPNKPIWLGPCTIPTRHNPYGAGVIANPRRHRIAAAGEDPRQDGLFAAAFAVAIAARAASSNVARLILAAPCGPFGLLGPDGRVRPLATINAILAGAGGSPRLEISNLPSGLAAIAFDQFSVSCLLLANRTAEIAPITLPASFRKASALQADGTMASLPTIDRMLAVPPFGVVMADTKPA